MLIFRGEKHLRFSWIALQPQKLFGKILHMNTMKACKSWKPQMFFGNEGKDMKQCRFFFTMNNKQYTASKSCC